MGCPRGRRRRPKGRPFRGLLFLFEAEKCAAQPAPAHIPTRCSGPPASVPQARGRAGPPRGYVHGCTPAWSRAERPQGGRAGGVVLHVRGRRRRGRASP